MSSPSSQEGRRPARRLLELDVLRGIAAFGVLVFHFTDYKDPVNVHPYALPFRFGFGMLGVYLFFMISGFVIFMTLENTRRPMDFVVSRFSRLYPAYWAAILLTFLAVSSLGLPGEERSLREVFVNLSMLQGFFRVPPVDSAYWTLQVELMFYIVMFCLFRFGLLSRILHLLWAWLGLRFIYLGAKTFFGIDLSWTAGQVLILQYVPYFALGMAFYLVRKQGRYFEATLITIAAAWALILWGEPLTVALTTLSFIAVFALFLARRLDFIAVTPLIFLGTISYPLYLLHQNIGKALIRRLYLMGSDSWLLNVIVAGVAVILLAAALSFLVEQPAMDWIRSRWKARMRTRSVGARPG